METFHYHVMRFMTGNRLTDRVSTKELLGTTTLTPSVPIIKSKVLKLVGHVKRSKAGLSNICLEGIMEGKRKQGRPHKRWCYNVYTWSQLNLNQLNLITKDRNQWKLYSHLSMQSGYSGESGIWWTNELWNVIKKKETLSDMFLIMALLLKFSRKY